MCWWDVKPYSVNQSLDVLKEKANLIHNSGRFQLLILNASVGNISTLFLDQTYSLFVVMLAASGKCLYLSGLIPEPMNACDDYRLKEIGIGFTNFVSRCSKGSVELTRFVRLEQMCYQFSH